ncbi:uncharacterized protein METZ01_LOCUS325209 [marine metagenome]|uniref:Uncharacterized protein n=1 Tax=marine metagenome TaxID=408172 RepID=A0A382PI92_9ZZZZ
MSAGPSAARPLLARYHKSTFRCSCSSPLLYFIVGRCDAIKEDWLEKRG